MTLVENGVRNGTGESVIVSHIPSSWIAPVSYSLTTTGTGAGHATIASNNCGLGDAFGTSLDTYDVCDAQGGFYNSVVNTYSFRLRASLDSHSDSGETFNVVLTDSSSTTNTLTFQMTINDPPRPPVSSIERHSPTSLRTDADLLTWRVTFREAVRNVDAADFDVSGTTAAVTGVSQVGSTNAYDITASGGDLNNLDGTVTLGLASGHNIRTADGNTLIAGLESEGTSHDSFVVANTAIPVYDITKAPADNPVNVWVQTAICSELGGGPTTSPHDCTERIRHNEVDATEGGRPAEITVGLSRALLAPSDIAVQTVTVPLIVSGANVSASDYTIALDATATTKYNNGVTLDTTVPNRPVVTFRGHSTIEVRFAMLLLSASADALTEGTETLRVDMGSVTSTNVTRGTGLHTRDVVHGARVRIIDVPTGMDESPTAGSAPTEAVTNLAVTALDATRASVRWDAVAHATSYDVSWQAENGDGSAVFTGDESVTGTSATVLHGAEEAMTLTVVVTPEYIDGNGRKQRLDNLAATARLAVGPGGTPNADAVSDGTRGGAQALEAAVANGSVTVGVPASWTGRGRPQVTGGAHRLAGWTGLGFDFRGLGDPPGTVTVSWSSRPAGNVKLPLEWQPVAGADWRHSDGEPIGKFEVSIADPAPQPQPQPQPQAAPAPEITISGGDGVTEGTAASFTLTAGTAPADELAVKVTIAQTGAVADASELGERTVTIPVGETEATFTVATLADGTDEPAGALTATVSDGTGYTVGGTGASATVAVEDDDETTVALSAPAGDLREAKAGAKTLTLTLGRALVEGERLAVPLTFAGTATLGSDYTLAAPKTAPKGVTYANLASTDPKTPPTVTFAGPAGGASAISATLALTAVADGAAEGERETVTVEPGTLVATGLGGGASASGTASFAILEPPPEISIAAKTASVTEGADAAFTLTASRAPGADLTVKLTVSEADGSDFVAADKEGAATATLPKGKTEAVFSVPTVDDAQDEPDGTVTATLGPDGKDGLRYTVAAAPKDAAQVKVADNDAAATGPTFSVGDETVDEKDGLMFFTVQLSTARDWPVSVRLRTRESSPVSAESGRDYWPMDRTLYFNSGQTEVRTWVYIFNDNHDEDPETFEVALSDARDPGGAVGIGDGVAVGTIVNSDPMPAAWLARFGRTAAEQALDGIAGRIAAPRTAGVQGAIAGQALNFDPQAGKGGNDSDGSDGPGGSATGMTAVGSSSGSLSAAQSDVARAFGAANGGFGSGFGNHGTGHDSFGFGTGAGGPQSRSMTAREALLGSSFTATGETDSSGGSLALWGRAAQSHFDGREGAFSLDGEATTAMLGADYARDRWMVGLALMQTSGKGGYRDTEPRSGAASRGLSQLCADNDDDADREDRAVLCSGAVREGDGKVEASLTAAIPYGAWQASERLKLWGAAGYGTGEVTLKPDLGGSYKADIAWTMAALGARGDVIAPPREGSGPALAVTSDALWARTSSDKTHDLAASESDVTRLRLGLEGSYRIALEEGGTVTPKLEVGARHDGGDAETGFGVELGGGLAWNDPALGLTLDLSGRTLIAHGNDDLKDRGYSASLAWDPDPATKRGPSFSLTQDWGGQARGGLDALFQTAPLADRTGGGEPTARWQAEAAYGFPVFGDRFTGSPHMGLGLATGSRDYSLGWRLTPTVRSPDLSFGLKATRRENDGTVPEHTFGFEAVARW